eukprot:Lithocolla_globosa_v1_NODE_3987_length_1535_cov_29.221622.p2 type:complete len:100 gc:universal NODE_3987_length_1535_cov_29.221622:1199-1498(+)
MRRGRRGIREREEGNRRRGEKKRRREVEERRREGGEKEIERREFVLGYHDAFRPAPEVKLLDRFNHVIYFYLNQGYLYSITSGFPSTGLIALLTQVNNY